MTRYWPMLLTLAAIWGASYLFIKVAVEDVEPGPMMAARLLSAGLVLLGYLVWRTGARSATAQLAASWRPALVLGAINAAIPFWLVGWGEKHVDSSIAGIAQATLPIFVLVLGLRFLPHEPVGPRRLAGIGLGILGVAVLTGFNPDGGWWAVAGTLAVVLSSVLYATGGVYGQLLVRSVSGPVLATGSLLAGGVYLLPIALLQLPGETPGWQAIGSIAALSLLGTAFAQLVLYRMLRLYGSGRLSLVTYLMPGFAVVYGALLLDEPVSVAAIGGLALILGGVALGSGAVRGLRGEPILRPGDDERLDPPRAA
jgi:drug/metabolite transporter (DMT)-like permease